MNQSKQITDGAILTAIYMILLLIAFYIPFLSMIAMFLLSIPFVIFAYKHSWKPSLIMLAATIILSSLLATIFSIPLTLLAACGGIMIGTAIHKGLSPYETWARGTVGFVVGLLFSFLISLIMFDVNIAEEMDRFMNESIQMSKDLMEQFGLKNQATEGLEIIQEQIEMFINLLPVWFVIISIIMALFSQWISYKVITRMDKKQYRFPPFRQLRFPTTIVWIYFLAVIMTLFQTDPNGMFFIGAQNILMLAGLLMAIQGFSFIFYFTHLKKKSKAIPIIIVILTVLIAPLLLPLVRILGIIDIGFRLRERISKD